MLYRLFVIATAICVLNVETARSGGEGGDPPPEPPPTWQVPPPCKIPGGDWGPLEEQLRKEAEKTRKLRDQIASDAASTGIGLGIAIAIPPAAIPAGLSRARDAS